MHMRKSVLSTGLAVLLLVLFLLPLACLLSGGKNAGDLSEENVVAQALEQQRLHEGLPKGVMVEPMMELEDVWAIEDTRTESETPLVIRMHHDEGELGYDSASQTFYCTLGMEASEDWPQILLFAGAASQDEALRVAWVDDYAYDYRCDAIREGYRYELLAYTDTQYAYLGVVFTGLPVVTLHIGYEGELGEEYVPARVSVASAEHEPIDSAALTHLRGGGYYKGIDKFSYRIEFHGESGKGNDKKLNLSVLGMEADSDWLLLSNAQDNTAVRNYLAYDMWNRWSPDEDALMRMDSQMVELFVDNQYMGLYQLMERIQPEKEILQAGGHLNTDSLVRLVVDMNLNEKPWIDLMERAHFFVEYRYGLDGDAKQVFQNLENFVLLSQFRKENRLDDESYEALVEDCIDVDDMLSFHLFLQAFSIICISGCFMKTEDMYIGFRRGTWIQPCQ